MLHRLYRPHGNATLPASLRHDLPRGSQHEGASLEVAAKTKSLAACLSGQLDRYGVVNLTNRVHGALRMTLSVLVLLIARFFRVRRKISKWFPG
jgi:hypothetical protein